MNSFLIFLTYIIILSVARYTRMLIVCSFLLVILDGEDAVNILVPGQTVVR